MKNNDEPPDRQRIIYIGNALHGIFRDKSQQVRMENIINDTATNPDLLAQYSTIPLKKESDFNKLFIVLMQTMGQELCNHFGRSPFEITARNVVYPLVRKIYFELYQAQ